MTDQLSVVEMARRRRGDDGGRFGAAHVNPRDAYRAVPILQQPTWHHEVAAYFFFGGVSAGAYVVGTLASLFGGQRGRDIARTAHLVSLVALLPCPALLIDDLGRPSRFHHMLRLFKPSSPMNLGAWALTVHSAFATLLALRLVVGQRKLRLLRKVLGIVPERVAAAAGLPTALTLGGYTGVLLGTTSVPVWSTSPLLGALFMTGSLSNGTAALRLAQALTRGQGHPAADPLVTVSLVLDSTELATLGAFLATSGPAAKPLVAGKARRLLAGAVAASVAGITLEVAGSRGVGPRRLVRALAAAATLLGGYLLRESVVQAGHESAADREAQLEAARPSARSPGWVPGA